ncbi:DNA replication complex GINS protein SLD5 [Planococcus citri]|uniref:DNA replication complex GINS protein SLD5 n=1 Tax=Planococcus citri TaxID=170843 RepID=UPI0031FA2D04
MSLDIADMEDDFLPNDRSEGDVEADGEDMTAQKVLETLESAWQNEKLCPEILPHKMEFVDCMLEQIKYMESNIHRLPKGDIKVDIHKIELERIRFIVTSYLRCRLKKIEQFASCILEEEAVRDPDSRYLSDSELKFAVEFVENLDTHFDTVLKEMPWNLQKLENNEKRIKPNLNSYVFCRTKATVPNVIVRDVFENHEEEISLDENTQYIIPYVSIADNVKNDTVQLI